MWIFRRKLFSSILVVPYMSESHVEIRTSFQRSTHQSNCELTTSKLTTPPSPEHHVGRCQCHCRDKEADETWRRADAYLFLYGFSNGDEVVKAFVETSIPTTKSLSYVKMGCWVAYTWCQWSYAPLSLSNMRFFRRGDPQAELSLQLEPHSVVIVYVRRRDRTCPQSLSPIRHWL